MASKKDKPLYRQSPLFRVLEELSWKYGVQFEDMTIERCFAYLDQSDLDRLRKTMKYGKYVA